MICCHQFVLGCNRREEVRFVATNLCSIITEGKKYDLLPQICARLSHKKFFCCQQFVFDCHRREKIRFLATNACSSQKGSNTIYCQKFVEGKKYDLLPPICARLSQKEEV